VTTDRQTEGQGQSADGFRFPGFGQGTGRLERREMTDGLDERERERWSWVGCVRRAGLCSCGRGMTHSEYEYYGGTFGYYGCSECGAKWEVDLNGVMWPLAVKEETT